MASNEHDPHPDAAPRGFNLDAFTDEQIRFMGRALLVGFERDQDFERDDRTPDATVKMFARQVALEPAIERTRAILRGSTLSTDPFDKVFAAEAAVPLATRDFDFAKDVIVHVQATEDHLDTRDNPRDTYDQGGYVFDMAVACYVRIKDVASPEQRRELEAAQDVVIYRPEEYRVPPSLAD